MSLRDAMELCLRHGLEQRNLSVEQVADQMGLASKWTLYKWLESGRMPALMIRPFEAATGATFVTEHLATSAHKLLIDIPTGRVASDDDILSLQTGFNDAVNLLIAFYRGDATAEETAATLTKTLGEIASHRANVAKSATPELGLFEGDGE